MANGASRGLRSERPARRAYKLRRVMQPCYQSSANQGFFCWEVDLSYYLLKVMSWLGLVPDLRTPSARVLTRQLVKDHPDTGMYPELALPAGGE